MNTLQNQSLKLQNLALAGRNFILNFGIDCSTSMGSHSITFPIKYMEMLDALAAAPSSSNIMIRVYEIAGSSTANDDGSIQIGCKKRCSLKHPSKVYRYKPVDFQMEENGGILKGGSPLRDGLSHIADRSLTDRKYGHKGPCLLGMFMDGYDRGSLIEPKDTRWKLQLCREKRITIMVVFFVFHNHYQLIEDFIREVGLMNGEYAIMTFRDENESQVAIGDAFDAMSESISNATENF
jgi:hypothetical protein